MGLWRDGVGIGVQGLAEPLVHDLLGAFGQAIVILGVLRRRGRGGVGDKVVVFLGVGQTPPGGEVQVDLDPDAGGIHQRAV